MSDGHIPVTVEDIHGHEAQLLLSVNDAGKVVVEPPAPGNYLVDPETQMPDLQNMLELCRQTGLRARQRAHKQAGS